MARGLTDGLIGAIIGALTGGRGAGAKNALRAGAGLAEATAVRSGPAFARQAGIQGERAAGIIGKKKRIESITGSAKHRIRDYWIGDTIKNVAHLSYTKQLQDFVLFAKKHDLTFVLVVRKNTTFSAPLERAIARGDIVIDTLPW